MVSIDDLGSYVSLTGLFKEPIIGSIQSKMSEIRHLENRHDIIFICRGWSDLDKISQTGTEWHVDCGDVWKWKPDVEFQYGRRLGDFNGMSSQSHVSHCRVLPLGEFTVTIPEPHATLQGAGCSHLTKSMSWSCHIAGCKNSIRHIENRFSPYFVLFLFLMQFGLWRAAAFVSSPIHLLLACCRSCRPYRPMRCILSSLSLAIFKETRRAVYSSKQLLVVFSRV